MKRMLKRTLERKGKNAILGLAFIVLLSAGLVYGVDCWNVTMPYDSYSVSVCYNPGEACEVHYLPPGYYYNCFTSSNYADVCCCQYGTLNGYYRTGSCNDNLDCDLNSQNIPETVTDTFCYQP